MERSTILSIAMCIWLAAAPVSGATAGQTSSEKPRNSQESRATSGDGQLKARAPIQVRRALRQKANSGLVAVLLGVSESDGNDLFKISQLFTGIEQDNILRIFQIEGKGALQNVIELAFARGVDAGLIQSDTLAALKREPPVPGIESFLQYVAKLYDKEVHLLVSSNVRSIGDLTGKSVNLGPSNSESAMTGARIFESLRVAVKPTHLAHPVALDMLKQGKIEGMVYVAAKPAELFQLVRPDDNLHFMSIPAGSDTGAGYSPIRLAAEDYPQIIEQGKTVETLGVGSILVVYNWAPGTDRYRKVVRFVRALLDKADDMKSGASPKMAGDGRYYRGAGLDSVWPCRGVDQSSRPRRRTR
jgi:uncharacterized protein